MKLDRRKASMIASKNSAVMFFLRKILHRIRSKNNAGGETTMKTVHIAEQYCHQCRREIGMEYAIYSDGKRERRCLSRFCEQELTPAAICRLTGKRIVQKAENAG